jgi:hypothetical protein
MVQFFWQDESIADCWTVSKVMVSINLNQRHITGTVVDSFFLRALVLISQAHVETSLDLRSTPCKGITVLEN